jgi:hypothetical protein
LASEKFPPFEKYDHADCREANGESHQGQNRWDKSILDSPVIEEKDHPELFLSAWIISLFETHTPKVFLTIVADTMICPGIYL